MPEEQPLQQSQSLKERASELIPGCSQTWSKSPNNWVQGVAPVYLQRGEGSHVWDVDGNEYIDYLSALGPITLGHNYPPVSAAVKQQMQEGTVFSLPHPKEVAVAELLTEIIPSAEMVRFAKNGADATTGAIRAARAYTSRDIIACCGYHGGQDWYLASRSDPVRTRGVPETLDELVESFYYNDINSLEQIFDKNPDEVAAVIMEPLDAVPPEEGFLEQVRELTEQEDALLIFDEVKTGFRISLGGAQEYYGVTPDLSCFAKGISNGYPLSAYVGRREVMEVFEEGFYSFTNAGETLSLAAAEATINEMRSEDVIDHLWEQGCKLQKTYNELAIEYGIDDVTECIGLPPRPVIEFEGDDINPLEARSLFQQECLKRGVISVGKEHICYSHSDADIERTQQVYREAVEVLADGLDTGNVRDRLEGDPMKVYFHDAEPIAGPPEQ